MATRLSAEILTGRSEDMNPQNMRDKMKVEKWGGSLIHALSRLAPRFLLLLVMVLSQSQAGAASGEVGGQVRVIIREVPEHDIAVRARQWVDETIQPFDQDDSPTRREKIAEAILKVGRRSVVQHGDGFNVMFVFYDEIDRRFRSDKHLVIQRMVAEMLVLKGMYMRDKRDRRESVAIFEEFEWRFGQNDDPIIRALSAKALVEKGIAWLKIDNPSAAIAAYDEAVSRFGEDEFPAVRAQVAYALLQKALALKDPSFLDVFNELDRRYGQDEDPEVRERVIEMLFRKARITGWPGGKEEDDRRALATYDEVNKRFGKGNAAVRAKIINELIRAGDEPFATNGPYYEQVIQWFGDDDELQSSVAWALIRWGMHLDDKDAIAAYGEAARRAGESLLAVDALDRKGRIHLKLGDLEAALAVYEDIGRRFGQTDRRAAALSLVRKGNILEKQGKLAEAVALFDEIEQRFGKDQVAIGYGFVSEAVKSRAAIKERLTGQ